MTRLAWLTDIHLNFLIPTRVDAFLRSLADTPADAFLLSGDVSEAPHLLDHLSELADAVRRPIHFVLGNHDFYRGSIAGVRDAVTARCQSDPYLWWLPACGVVPLTEETGLVGVDGWGDGRLGDYFGSEVMLNDWGLIAEFGGFEEPADERLKKLHALGDEAAAHLRAVLPDALDRFRRVIVVTHVPPFREACWHQGRTSGDDWLPHFTCKAVGDVLLEAMRTRPDRTMTVLCGHTHGAGEADLLPNLHVSTGGATYGEPRVQRVFELP